MSLYNNIEQAIRQHEETLHVDDDIQESDVRHAIRWVMRDNPGIFWFVHQYHFDLAEKTLSFRYRISRERREIIQRSIGDVVENDFQIEHVRTLGLYEQVMYVYKWLLSYCNYNVNSAYNQCIDSVFVRRNSVCTGYAKAAQYLFELLGIESRLVFGRLNNDREDGRHCWNIVVIKGQSYHLDVCLGDVALEGVLGKAGATTIRRSGQFNYNCFCASTEEIAKTRSIEDADSLPNCEKSLDFVVVERLSLLPISERSNAIGCLLTPIGSSADIFLCAKDKNVVLKKFRGDDNLKCTEEYMYMDRLRGCDHILQLNDSYTDVSNNIIAVEQSTPIVDLYCSHYYLPTLHGVLNMIKDIAEGWRECYERGILYRDIHVCNIYRSNECVYKLGDFGSCADVHNRSRERVGNQWFMSPETYLNGQFDERSAVYSITAVLYFILNGLRPPFVYNGGEAGALSRRMRGVPLVKPSLLNSFPTELTNEIMNRLITKGCAYSPSVRIRSTKELILEIDSLQNKINGLNLEIRYTQQNSTSILDLHTLNIDIPRDAFHKLANGEDVERMALSMSMCWEDVERTAATEIPYIIDIDNSSVESGITYDIAISHNGDLEGSICWLEDIIGKSCASSDEVENYCRTMGSWDIYEKLQEVDKAYDEVFGSVFAPAEVKQKSYMLVQVYLHLFEETEKVKELAQEVDKNAERRDYIPLQCKLKRDDRVDVLLNIYGETLLKSEQKSVVWHGSFTKCSFDYFVPKDIGVDELSCVALLTVNDIPVGEMRFITKIVEHPRQLNPEVIAHKYSKVFISYSHKDESKVKFLHEGLEIGGIQHFFDRNYLKAGDVFPQVIQDYINSADLFVLCWSENAAQSEYVKKERLQALKLAYPQVKPPHAAKLSIYPMSIEPRAELPSDMKDNYHFGKI